MDQHIETEANLPLGKSSSAPVAENRVYQQMVCEEQSAALGSGPLMPSGVHAVEHGAKRTRSISGYSEDTTLTGGEGELNVDEEITVETSAVSCVKKKKPRHQRRSTQKAKRRAAAELAVDENVKEAVMTDDGPEESSENGGNAPVDVDELVLRDEEAALDAHWGGVKGKKAGGQRGQKKCLPTGDLKTAALENEEDIKSTRDQEGTTDSLAIRDLGDEEVAAGDEKAAVGGQALDANEAPATAVKVKKPRLDTAIRNKARVQATYETVEQALSVRKSHIQLPLRIRLQPFQHGFLVLCHNVRTASVKIQGVYETLLRTYPRPHVIALQEVHSWDVGVEEAFKTWGYDVVAQLLEPKKEPVPPKKRDRRKKPGVAQPPEAPGETRVEQPAEAPGETHVEQPAEAPGETRVEQPAEAPGETRVEQPAEAPGETRVEQPLHTPKIAGVALLVDRTRVLAAPIAITFPKPSYSKFEACAAHVMLKESKYPQGIGICSAYMRPDTLAGDVKASVEMLEPIFQILRAADVDMVVGDLNCAHPLWSPHVAHNINNCISDDAMNSRGARLLSMVLNSPWSIANDGSGTLPPRRNGDHITTPDAVFHQDHLQCSFAVYADGEKKDEVRAEQLKYASDHLPIYSQVAMDVVVERKIKFRCPQLRLSAVKDWEAVKETFRKIMEEKCGERVAEEKHAKYHFLFFVDFWKQAIRTLPQCKRQITIKPYKWSDAVLAAEKDAKSAIDTPQMTEKMQVFREKLDKQASDERVYAMNKLTNPRKKDAFWRRAVNQICVPKTNVKPCLLHENGYPLPVRTQAREFATFFQHKFDRSRTEVAEAYSAWLTAENENMRPPSDLPVVWNQAEDQVTVTELKLAISRLRKTQSGDPLGLKPQLLKHLPEDLYVRMAAMMTASLRDAYVPREWRLGVAVPAFKGGDKDPGLVTSFRPLMITDLNSRTEEMVLLDRLRHHARALEGTVHAFSWRQFAFKGGVSTDMLLGSIVGDLAEAPKYVHNWNSPIHGSLAYSPLLIKIDFSDAYCRLTPEKVEWALRKKNFPDVLVRWIRAFMTGRRLRASYEGRLSRSASCDVGTPQGSVISPFLWCTGTDDLLVELETLTAGMEEMRLQKDDFELGKDNVGIKKDFCLAYHALKHEDGTELNQLIPETMSFSAPVTNFAAYADDVVIWAFGPTPGLTATSLQLMLNCITQWADRNGITVNAKTEGRWFMGGNQTSQLAMKKPLKLQVQGGNSVIIPPLPQSCKNPAPPIRVLGVDLDHRLGFTPHALKVAARSDNLLLSVRRRAALMAPSVLAVVLTAAALSQIRYALAVIFFSASVEAKKILERAWYRVCLAITRTLAKTRGVAVLIEADVRSLECEAKQMRLKLLYRTAALSAPYRALCAYIASRREGGIANQGIPGHSLCARNVVKHSWRSDLPSIPANLRLLRREWEGFAFTTHCAYMAAYGRCTFLSTLLFDKKKVKRCAITATPEVREANQRLLRAFNAVQLDSSKADVTLWTDAATPEEGSGGAYVITGLKTPQGGLLSLGEGACSYAVERAAIRKGLEAIVAYVRQHPEVPWDQASIRVVTDSLSTLAALHRGPTRQCNEELERIWSLLADLPFFRIFLVFMFSHTNDTPDMDKESGGAKNAARSVDQILADELQRFENDVERDGNASADKLAKAAVSKTATEPVWGVDVVRPLLKAEMREFDISDEVRNTLIFKALGENWFKKQRITSLRCDARDQRILFQLRTGACYLLGAYLHGVTERCPHCSSLRTRASSAIEGISVDAVWHMFNCPVFSIKYPPPASGVKSLWLDPEEGLKYFSLYVRSERTPPQPLLTAPPSDPTPPPAAASPASSRNRKHQRTPEGPVAPQSSQKKTKK